MSGCCASGCCQKSDSYTIANDKPRNHEDEFKGPVDKRSCTDVFCCILFSVFLIIFGILSLWSFAMGDMRKLIYPTDSNGKMCGIDYPDRKYLIFFDLTRCINLKNSLAFSCPTEQVCISKCPKENLSFLTALDNSETRSKMICKDNKNALDPPYAERSIRDLVSQEECAAFTLASSNMLYRCMPKLFADAFHTGDVNQDQNATVFQSISTSQLENTEGHIIQPKTLQNASFSLLGVFSYVESSLHDLRHNWWIMLSCIVASIVFCLVYIVLMRYLARFMVWFTLILFVLIFTAGSVFSFIQYARLKKKGEDHHYELTLNIGAYFQIPTTWLVLGIILCIVLVIMLIIMIALRKRLNLAIAVIKEASLGVANMLSTLVWPFVPYLLTCIVLLFCIVVFMQLKSVSEPDKRVWEGYENADDSQNPSTGSKRERIRTLFRSLPCNVTATGRRGDLCRFMGYGGKKYIIYLQAFALFMTYWLLNFITAFHEMTLAGAFAYFYFCRNKREKTFPVLAAARNALCYHMGTLAFGSLIVSIVQFIRSILDYIQYKLKGTENPVTKFLLKCLSCCFWCLEKILRFINRNAYIMTAIYSQNFCQAARNAFSLLMRNIVRVFVLDKVSDFVFFLGRMVIIALSAGTYYILSRGHVIFPDNILSLAVVLVCSYLIGKLFFSVYSMGVDTIFLCVLEDLERNDGSPERPYMMSAQLMDGLDVMNMPKPKPASEEKVPLNV